MDLIEWLESLRNQGMKLGLDNTREIYVAIVIEMIAIAVSPKPNCVFVACTNPEIVEVKITEVWIRLIILTKSLYLRSSSRLHSLDSSSICKLFLLAEKNSYLNLSKLP